MDERISWYLGDHYLIQYCDNFFNEENKYMKPYILKKNRELMTQIKDKLQRIYNLTLHKPEHKSRLIILIYKLRCYKQLGLIKYKEEFESIMENYKEFDQYKHVDDVLNHLPLV